MIKKVVILLKALYIITPSNWVTFILLCLKKDGQMYQIKTTHGLKVNLLANGIDYWLFAENLVLDSYKLELVKNYSFNTVVDVGANIGLFSCRAHQIWHQVKIVCLEPNPESFNILNTNMNLNQIESTNINVSLIGSKKANYLKLFFNENPAMVSSVRGKGRSFYSSTITLEDVVKKIVKPALLKIDIEGGEYQLLNVHQLKTLMHFDLIVFEYHDITMKFSFKNIISFLNYNQINYRVYNNIIHLYLNKNVSPDQAKA